MEREKRKEGKRENKIEKKRDRGREKEGKIDRGIWIER